MSESRNKQSTEKFLALAHARWKLAAEAEAESRREALDDLKFSVGEQWTDEIRQRRESKSRPCLTLNRLPQFIRQITNNQRQQRPAISVNPAGDGSIKDVAEILQGMCRHIEVASDAEVAYDTAFEYMARTGRGFWRILTQYCDDGSFDQEIVIEAVDPFAVYTDPATRKPDRSDARFKFIVEDMSHDEYRAQHPNSELASLTDMSSVGDRQPEWATRDSVRVAEYFYVETESSTLEKNGVRGKVMTREVVKRKVKWAKINAVEILDERDWPGQWIPIVEVTGDDLIVDGKRYTAGIVRDAKDPQRMYNYWNSAATEAVALAPKAPFIGVKGQFTDSKWEYANVENYAYLEAEPVDINGAPAPLPQRNAVEPPIGAMTRMILQADNDLKAIIGIYDPSLGQRISDQSGRAILALQKQGDLGTSNYSDNLSRAMRFTGRILVDLIPKIYDAPRVQRIINPDQTVDQVGIYNSQSPAAQSLADPRTMQQLQAVAKIYDIGVGKYDVTVQVGPSYQSKRQEAVASMLELVKTNPTIFPAIGDLLVRNMDWHNSNEIADRLKKMLPPQLQDGDAGDPAARAQKLQAQLQAMSQQHQMLTTEVQKLTEMVKTKQVEQETKLAIAKLDADVKIAVAEITAKAQNQIARAKMELDAYGMIHDSAHEVAMQAADKQPAVAGQAQQVGQAQT